MPAGLTTRSEAFGGWVGTTGPEAAAALDRALAASGPPGAGRPSSRRGLGELGRGDPAVRGATRCGGWPPPARQADATTCGSAVAGHARRRGRPGLARRGWPTGWLPAVRPPAALGRHERSLDGARAATAARPRSASSSGCSSGGPPLTASGRAGWPAALGTPPWGAARVARFPGVRYTHRDRWTTPTRRSCRRARPVAAGCGRGVPVPLYAGGDTPGGWDRPCPRHVVLAVGAHPDRGLGGVRAVARDRVLPLACATGPGSRPRARAAGATWSGLLLPRLKATGLWRVRPAGADTMGAVSRAEGAAMSTIPGESTWVDAGLVPPEPERGPSRRPRRTRRDHVAVTRPGPGRRGRRAGRGRAGPRGRRRRRGRLPGGLTGGTPGRPH